MDKLSEKYSRQVQLAQIGEHKQQLLQQSHILIVGLGGLGCAASSYLAAAGVGRMTLADFDVVEHSNLSRQILHYESDIGRPKIESASEKLRQLSADIQLHWIEHAIEFEDLADTLKQVDLVIDCSDNFPARHAVNQACIDTQTAWISGAAIGWQGSVVGFYPGQPESACYACLYPDSSAREGVDCQQHGVVSPLVGVIGTLQAQLGLNTLIGIPKKINTMLQFDAQSMQFMRIKLNKRAHCFACAKG